MEGAGGTVKLEDAAAPAAAPNAFSAGLSDQHIVQALRRALETVELAQTTERQLRKQLEAQFGIDLTDRKHIIREEVEKFLEEQEPLEAEDESDSDDMEAAAPQRRGAGLGSTLSEPMAAFVGQTSMPRTQVVKKIWEYIKANDLQDPNNKRKIVCDDKLKTIFTPPIDMFSMNKQLSKHVFTSDGGGGSAPRAPAKRKSSPAAAGQGKPKKAKKPQKKKKEGGSSNNGFQIQLKVTPEMADWLGGQTTISRPELTSFFWKYVKDKQLQNPSNKKEIVADEKLRQLTGEDRFQGFGFMKHMSKHLLKDD